MGPRMDYPLLGWVYEGVAVGLLSGTSDASYQKQECVFGVHDLKDVIWEISGLKEISKLKNSARPQNFDQYYGPHSQLCS